VQDVDKLTGIKQMDLDMSDSLDTDSDIRLSPLSKEDFMGA